MYSSVWIEWDVPHWACGGGGVTSPFKNGRADHDSGEYCGLDQLKCQWKWPISFQIDQTVFILMHQFIHAHINY